MKNMPDSNSRTQLWSRRAIKKIADLTTPTEHDFAKWERKNRLLRRAGLNIAPTGVAIDSGFECLLGLEENITIFDNVAIGRNARFWAFAPVSIGKFCMFAAEVSLSNGAHDKNTFAPSSAPLVIGNGCWLGTRAQIVGPLTIGDNVIVAAGAVVIRDVESETIVAGVPARPIGKRDLPEKVWHLGNTYFCPETFRALPA